MIGADEGEEGGFAGTVGTEDTPAGTPADGPVETVGGLALSVGLGPVAEDDLVAVSDLYAVHFDDWFAQGRETFVTVWEAFSTEPLYIFVYSACWFRLLHRTKHLLFGTLGRYT